MFRARRFDNNISINLSNLNLSRGYRHRQVINARSARAVTNAIHLDSYLFGDNIMHYFLILERKTLKEFMVAFYKNPFASRLEN